MKRLTDRLQQLIKVAIQLREEVRSIDNKNDIDIEDYHMKYDGWRLSCLNFFEKVNMLMFLKSFEDIEAGQSYPAAKIAKLTGILRSAIDEIELGFVQKIQYLLHAEMFSSINEQAKQLLETGYKTAAAVLGRIIIERWVFDTADQNGIQRIKSDTPATINEKLKQQQIFSIPRWRSIQSYLDIGNSAAHGDDEAFKKTDVESMLKFVEINCN